MYYSQIRVDPTNPEIAYQGGAPFFKTVDGGKTWRQVQGLVLASRGEYAEAERLVRDAIAIVDRTDALNHQGDARCDLAEVLERAGRAGDAKAALEQALERYERKRNLAMVAQVRKRLGAGGQSVPLA